MINQDPIAILDAAGADGIGTAILVVDFRNVMLALNTTGSTTAVTKIQISYQKERPDFAAAQSPTNQWDYAKIVDLEDGSSLDGDVGVVQSATDANRNFEVDVNGASWLNAIISGYSAGAIHLDARPLNTI